MATACLPSRAAVLLALNACGLTIDGDRVDITEAVRRAQRSSTAHVAVGQDAPAATYIELMAALRHAGVPARAAPRRVAAGTGRNIGPSGATPFRAFDNVKTFDDLYEAQLLYLAQQRGSDQLDPEPGMSGGRRLVPRTTNADVVLLADYWTDQLDRVKRVFGAAGVEERWATARADVDALARSGAPTATYANNNRFWRLLQQAAIHVAVADEAPSKADLMLDALKDSLLALPHRIVAGVQTAGAAVADVASGAARAVGGAAGSFGRAMLGPLGIPVLVGGGALVALYLVSRNKRTEG
jgi:hypothetical protein